LILKKKNNITQRIITKTIKSTIVPYLDLEKFNLHHHNLSLYWPSVLFRHRHIFRGYVGLFGSDTPLMMCSRKNYFFLTKFGDNEIKTGIKSIADL
jgi:hypothetical protein